MNEITGFVVGTVVKYLGFRAVCSVWQTLTTSRLERAKKNFVAVCVDAGLSEDQANYYADRLTAC